MDPISSNQYIHLDQEEMDRINEEHRKYLRENAIEFIIRGFEGMSPADQKKMDEFVEFLKKNKDKFTVDDNGKIVVNIENIPPEMKADILRIADRFYRDSFVINAQTPLPKSPESSLDKPFGMK